MRAAEKQEVEAMAEAAWEAASSQVSAVQEFTGVAPPPVVVVALGSREEDSCLGVHLGAALEPYKRIYRGYYK